MEWKKRNLLSIDDLSREEIEFVLSTAESMKEISKRDIKKVPTLRGKTMITLFYEPSTRTRVSFEIAAKRLSADTISISTTTSSIVKGEGLIDTIKNLEAMSPDVIVIRHSAAGAPYLVAKHTRASVINGGDGAHEHPTQALLDLLTIKEMKGSISALKVSIIGDISQSRVARSNIAALVKMGASVTVCGPLTMIPIDITKLGISVTSDITEAIMDADVIMMLRIQLERQQKNTFPSAREYSRIFGLNMDTLKHIKKEVTIMHPGPINRGIEIAPEVADGPFSVILNQVENGVAIRMALLYLLIGGVD